MTTLMTIGLMSSMFLLFVVLRTFSTSTQAYALMSLVPLGFGLIVFALRFVAGVEQAPDHWWADFYEKVVWASAIQTALGIALIARAAHRRRPLAVLMVTTLLTGSLVWVRVFRWI